VWHSNAETDELFLVLDGELEIEFAAERFTSLRV
jgi:uncharacterized cupin superfamily protein